MDRGSTSIVNKDTCEIPIMTDIHLRPGAGGMLPRAPGAGVVIVADGVCHGLVELVVEALHAGSPTANRAANSSHFGINTQ